jgi:PBSX family phage terminase large subunit
MNTVTEACIPAPELRGAALALGSCRDLEVCLDGPAGTGKTIGALFKIHVTLLMYPGAKALVSRKTNTALAGSALATYREHIIDPREGVHYFGGNKVKPAAFQYPNGSEMIVNGLDKPDKVKSWEFDLAYINEATECDEEDAEFVRSRLRHGKIGYHQLIYDVNPGPPNHWLNQRMISGKTKRLLSRHEDNPRFFDGKNWTEAGQDYIFGTLGGLTGVRLARLRYGIWAAAEGTVYEESWNRARNVVAAFPIPLDWPRYLCLDFGYTNPFVCKWYAEDPDGRLYCYREIYMTKRLVEDHAKQIKEVSRWGEKGGDPFPREVIADHDAEDRKTFERHTGLMTTAAHKSVSDGIQAVSSRLRNAGDSKPRLMYFSGCLLEVDQELAKAKRPTCTVDEFDSYVWKEDGTGKREEPVKENDHGMDTDRYMVAHRDLAPTGVSYVKNIWR